MRFKRATTELRTAVRAIISANMVEAIIRQKTNTASDIAVIHDLAREGFGAPSIRALRRTAVKLFEGQSG